MTCRWCHRVATRGQRCAPCADALNAKQESKRLSALAGRQCVRCGAPASHHYCDNCAAVRAEQPARQTVPRRREYA